MTLKTGSKK